MSEKPLDQQIADLTRRAFVPNEFYKELMRPTPLLQLLLENQPPLPPLSWLRRILCRLGWYEARYRVGRAWAALKGEDE